MAATTRASSATSIEPLLCVGSGLTPRYRANTLQAIALPRDSLLQFRYDEALLKDHLKAKLASSSAGTQVLMGHVDCTPRPGNDSAPCRVVPYREAELIECRRVGSFFILQLRLGEYRIADDLSSFQSKIGSDGPRWERSATTNDLVGRWCQELPAALAATRRTGDFKDWQKIVTQLKKERDFRAQPYFHLIEGIFEGGAVKDGPAALLASGEFQLRAGKHYDLRVVHYDPDGGPHTAGKATRTLSAEFSAPLLTARTNPRLLIDSPYDAKSVVFMTGDASSDQYGSILLQPSTAPTTDDEKKASGDAAASPISDDVPELYLPVRVKASIPRTTGRILLFAAFLAGTQLAPALLKADVAVWVVAIVVVALGLCTSAFVNIGMKRPF